MTYSENATPLQFKAQAVKKFASHSIEENGDETPLTASALGAVGVDEIVFIGRAIIARSGSLADNGYGVDEENCDPALQELADVLKK